MKTQAPATVAENDQQSVAPAPVAERPDACFTASAAGRGILSERPVVWW